MNIGDIKIFITDIDGVWTDGGMYYDQTDKELKRFNTADSTGVLFLRLLNIPIAIITGELTQIVTRRAEKLKIDYLFQGVRNKLYVAKSLCESLNIGLNNVAYIGDDINDIHLLKAVGLSACPISASDYIQEMVDWVIPVKGGEGAFRFFVEKYLKEIGQLKQVIDLYLNLGEKIKQ